MTTWSEFLRRQGAVISPEGAVLHFGNPDLTLDQPRLIPLQEGVLTLTGPDALKFLQGQSTTDCRELTDQTSRLGCCVNLKGRALFSFRALAQGDTVQLLLAPSLREQARAHLGKYIVFSKATLSDDSDQLAVLGLTGSGSVALLQRHWPLFTLADQGVWHHPQLSVLRLPGAPERLLLLCRRDQAPALWNQLAADVLPAGEPLWRLSEIEAGEARIEAATSENIQPQEMHYQLLGGVSYSKGCYTGQEVVARLYYRGKPKSLLFHLFSPSDAAAPPGSALQDRDGHAVGEVLQAVSHALGTDLLAVVRLDAVQDNNVFLPGQTSALRTKPLPYAIPDKQ